MECTTPLPYTISSCSGNGYKCSVPDIGCICYSGWTSLSDLSLGSTGPDCLIHYGAVRIISYLCIIIPSICNILIIWHYISIAIQKKSCYVISREYKTIFPFCFLIMGIASVIYGILKVSYPDGRQPLIGRDVSISMMVLIATTSGFLGMVLYLHVIIKFLKGYSRVMPHSTWKRVSNRLNLLGFYSWFITPTVLIVDLLPLISIAYPSHSKELGMAHLIGFSISTLFYDVIFCSCLSFLIKELKLYIDSIEAHLSKDIKVVVRRLNKAYVIVGGAALQIGILSLIFGCSNFLFHLTTYFLLISYTFVSPALYFFVITVARISHSDDNNQIVPSNYDEISNVTNEKLELV